MTSDAGQPVARVLVSVRDEPSVETGERGDFTFRLREDYRSSLPLPVSVQNWVVKRPFAGKRGWLFVTEGDIAAVVVKARGEDILGDPEILRQTLVEAAFEFGLETDRSRRRFLQEQSDLLGVPIEALTHALRALGTEGDPLAKRLAGLLFGESGEILETCSRAGDPGEPLYNVVAQAKARYLADDFTTAEECLLGALRIQPDDPRLREDLGLVLLAQGRLKEAALALGDSLGLEIQVWGDSSAGACEQASVLRRLATVFRYLAESAPQAEKDGYFANAEESLHEALSRLGRSTHQEDRMATILQLAGLEEAWGKSEAAGIHYREIAESGDASVPLSDRLEAMRRLALLLPPTGDSIQARELLNRALELARTRTPIDRKESTLCLVARGDLELALGDLGAAEGYFQRAATEASSPTRLPGPLALAWAALINLNSRRGQSVEARMLRDRLGTLFEAAPKEVALALSSRPVAQIQTPPRVSELNLRDWTLRFTFDSSLVPDLPLAGTRSFDQLALLAPGVFRVPFTPGSGPAVGLGVGVPGQFTVNGFRGRHNNFTIDGADNNDADIGVRRQGFVARTPQPIGTIQDFQIQTAGFQPEFGRSAGSIVNIVSRSGGKNWHGALYAVWDDDALAARRFFDQPFEDPVNSGALDGGRFPGKDFSRRQLGGVLGGAVGDRLFLFGSLEQVHERGTALGHFAVPDPEERGLRVNPQNGSSGDGFVPIDELSEFFARRGIRYGSAAGVGTLGLYPLPNNSKGPFGGHTYSQARPKRGDGVTASAKADLYLGPRHAFTARFNFTNDDSLIPFTGESLNSALGTDTRTDNLSTYLNSTRENLANLVRFSFGRTRLFFPPDRGSPLLFGSRPESGSNPSSQAIETTFGSFGPFGATGPIGQLAIVPYSSIGIDVFNFPQGRVDNTWQVSDLLDWSRQGHDFKFGFDIRYSRVDSFSDRNSRPLVVFGQGRVSQSCQMNPTCPFSTPDGRLSGTDSAALGAAAGVLQTLSTAGADSGIRLAADQFDFFVQDNWRILKTLTLNLGLRYELPTVPSEAEGLIEDTFGLSPGQFSRLDPADFGDAADRRAVASGNAAFDAALIALQQVVAGRRAIYDADHNNFAPRIGFAWSPNQNGRLVVRGGYGVFYEGNLGAVTSQSRNVFPRFVPVNLDPNFNVPNGDFLNSLFFARFDPTGESLIRPGTLAQYNLTGDSFATGLGVLFRQAPPFPGASLSGNGLAFTLPERKLQTAYGQHFSLSAEKQFGPYVFGATYVGTRGAHLVRFVTPNGGLVSTPLLFFPVPGPQPLRVFDAPPTVPPGSLGRPNSSLGSYRLFQNSANSVYHSLQISMRKAWSAGFQTRVNWVWSHAIDDVSDPFDVRGAFSLPQDTTNLGSERGSAGFDVRQRVTALAVWDLPSWGGSALSRNWRAALVAEFQGGQPFTVNTSIDANQDGNLTDRPDSLRGIGVHPDSAQSISLAEALSPLDLVAPLGANGSIGRNTFRSDGIANLDVALTKRFKFGEDRFFDIRVEIFNLFNHTSFGIPIRILESPGFGRSFDTQVDPRQIRIFLKLEF